MLAFKIVLTKRQLTINLAFGGNSALESTAAFVNVLNRELKALPAGEKLSQETISEAFEEYQGLRKPRMKKVLNLAYQLTRLQAWDGWFMKFIQSWVIPWVGDGQVVDHFSELVRAGHRLDFVPVPSHKEGYVPFNDELKDEQGPLYETHKAPSDFGSVIRRVVLPWIAVSSALVAGAAYSLSG